MVVRDGEAVIERCLDRLLDQDHSDYEIVVVDDGSTDRTPELLAAYAAQERVRTLSSGGVGVAAARNVALREARGAVVAFIDADGFAERGWLVALCDRLAADDSLAAVASLVLFDSSPTVINGAGGMLDVRGHSRDHCFGEPLESAELPRDVLYPMGCGMAFRSERLREVGGFDRAYVNYYDDAEAGIRVWRAGWRVLVEPAARIRHAGGHSASSQSGVLNQRHRLRTMLVHAPIRALPRWLAGELPWLIVPSEAREVLRAAWRWNLIRLPEAAAARIRWSRRPQPPRHLLAPGRAKLPEDPPPPAGPFLHGWYEEEKAGGKLFRWTAARASRRLEAAAAASIIRITYRLPPAAPAAQLQLRKPGGTPLAAAELPCAPGWQTLTIEARLPAGSYEAVLAASRTYVDARRRRLGIAVTELELV